MSRRLTTEEFKKISDSIHKNKYDYSKVNYIDNKKKVCIICPDHGEFWQQAAAHMKGSGCKGCATRAAKERRDRTTEEFIQEANKIHNGKYDYSKSIYTKVVEKLIITCPVHGDFEQQACSHLQGHGCFKCGNEYIAKLRSNSKEDILKRLFRVHGDKYDYSKLEYTGIVNKVKIVCPKHGVFDQVLANHLNGAGCPKCGRDFSGTGKAILYFLRLRKDSEDFYKIGITLRPNAKYRMKEYSPYDVEYLGENTGQAWLIKDSETIIKDLLKEFRYEPIHNIDGGKTECFYVNPIVELKEYFDAGIF